MKKGGSVADAAIAALLCDGVACGERMGIGGGFILLHYHRARRVVDVLLAREVAPSFSHKHMYTKYMFNSLYGK